MGRSNGSAAVVWYGSQSGPHVEHISTEDIVDVEYDRSMLRVTWLDENGEEKGRWAESIEFL